MTKHKHRSHSHKTHSVDLNDIAQFSMDLTKVAVVTNVGLAVAASIKTT